MTEDKDTIKVYTHGSELTGVARIRTIDLIEALPEPRYSVDLLLEVDEFGISIVDLFGEVIMEVNFNNEDLIDPPYRTITDMFGENDMEEESE